MTFASNSQAGFGSVWKSNKDIPFLNSFRVRKSFFLTAFIAKHANYPA
jgi:hypothetical protein